MVEHFGLAMIPLWSKIFFGLDFRYDKGDVRLHAEGAAVVDHRRAGIAAVGENSRLTEAPAEKSARSILF